MREPTRKCQKEWSFEPPMCTVDRDQLHLSVQSELCAWRSAPEQQIAIQRQGEWCLSPCHKLRPLPMSHRDQRPCSDEQMVESVPSAWIPSQPSPPILTEQTRAAFQTKRLIFGYGTRLCQPLAKLDARHSCVILR